MEEQHDVDNDDDVLLEENKLVIKEKEECAICLSSIEENTDLSITKCGHHFHCSCLIKAALKKRQCPMCRKNLLEENNNEEEDIISDNRVYIFNGQFPLIIQQLREIFENNPLVATPSTEEQKDDDEFDDEFDDEYSDDNSIFNDLPGLIPFENSSDDDNDDNDDIENII